MVLSEKVSYADQRTQTLMTNIHHGYKTRTRVQPTGDKPKTRRDRKRINSGDSRDAHRQTLLCGLQSYYTLVSESSISLSIGCQMNAFDYLPHLENFLSNSLFQRHLDHFKERVLERASPQRHGDLANLAVVFGSIARNSHQPGNTRSARHHI